MFDLTHIVMSANETPSPAPTIDPDLVTPGPLGFAVMAIIVIAVFVLGFSLIRRVRRTRYRGEVQEMLDAEERAAAEQSDEGRDDERRDG